MLAGVGSTLLVFALLFGHHRYHFKDLSPEESDRGNITEPITQDTLLEAAAAAGTTLEAPSIPSTKKSPSLMSGLMVPHGKRLACSLPFAVLGKRQEITFTVNSSESKRNNPLMLVRISETLPDFAPRIQLEQLPEPGDHVGEPHGWISTENLYEPMSPGQPVRLGAYMPSGDVCAYLGRTSDPNRGSGYLMVGKPERDESPPVLRFTGNFDLRSIRIDDAMDRLVAITEPSSRDYETLNVEIYADVDAGLILLGLLAIGKWEAAPGPPPGSPQASRGATGTSMAVPPPNETRAGDADVQAELAAVAQDVGMEAAADLEIDLLEDTVTAQRVAKAGCC